VLNIPSRGGEGITFFDSLETKDCPISSLASSEALVASGNDNGDIYCFDPNESFVMQCSFDGSGFPCTTLAAKEDTIVAGFSSGHIRVYNFFQKQQIVEVAAHARTITGMSMHPDLFLVASCSEDQHMHVWSVPDMSILSANVVDNKKLTGVTFMTGDRVGVVAYDDDEITVFNRT
jgi:WD repeat-containing protein 54